MTSYPFHPDLQSLPLGLVPQAASDAFQRERETWEIVIDILSNDRGTSCEIEKRG